MKKRFIGIAVILIGILFAFLYVPTGTHSINANVSSTVGHGIEVTFEGERSYEWDVDGDNTFEKEGNQVTHIYSEPSERTVKVRYNGEVRSYDVEVVNSPPVVRMNKSPTLSTSQRLVLNASDIQDPNGDSMTYKWDVDGDGVYEKSGVSVNRTFDSTGDYTLSLRVTDEYGASDSDEFTVTVR